MAPTVRSAPPIVTPSNVGTVSAATCTTKHHGGSAASPSSSVAVSVYVVAGRASVGVPAMVPPSAAASSGAVYDSPGGSAGASA